MHHAALALALSATGAAASAAPLNLADPSTAQVLGVVMAADRLRDHCPTAGAAPLADQVRTWEAQNRLPAFRAAVVAARKAPEQERVYQALASAVAAKLSPFDNMACTGLSQWITAPMAQVAQAQPQVFAGLGAQGPAAMSPAPTPARTAQAAQGVARPVNATAPAPLSASAIHGYGLIQTYGMGYGGMITVNFVPAVLFRSGEILTDMDGLADPAGDRRANPRHWSRWRQTGGVYEYATESGKWSKILGNQVWTSAPTTALAGRYTYTGGGGNIALGGTDAVFVEQAFEFQPGGRIVRNGFAGSSASVEGGGSRTTTTTSSRAGARGGRYSVQGLTLQIAYDDGSRESHTFMTHPKDPDIIWIDGTSYIKRSR